MEPALPAPAVSGRPKRQDNSLKSSKPLLRRSVFRMDAPHKKQKGLTTGGNRSLLSSSPSLASYRPGSLALREFTEHGAGEA